MSTELPAMQELNYIKSNQKFGKDQRENLIITTIIINKTYISRI